MNGERKKKSSKKANTHTHLTTPHHTIVHLFWSVLILIGPMLNDSFIRLSLWFFLFYFLADLYIRDIDSFQFHSFIFFCCCCCSFSIFFIHVFFYYFFLSFLGFWFFVFRFPIIINIRWPTTTTTINGHTNVFWMKIISFHCDQFHAENYIYMLITTNTRKRKRERKK